MKSSLVGLFIVLSVCGLFCVASARIDTTSVKRCIGNLEIDTKKIESSTDTLLQFLIEFENDRNNNWSKKYIDSSYGILRSMFQSSKRISILNALSRFPTTIFDDELSSLFSSLDSLRGNNIKQLSKIIRTCGGPLTYQSLLSTCKVKAEPEDIDGINIKVSLWKLLFSKNFSSTFNHCFGYYSFDILGLRELNSSDSVMNMLLSALNIAEQNDGLFATATLPLQNFILADDRSRLILTDGKIPDESLIVGPSTTNRYKVIRAIFYALVRRNTPRCQALLTQFLRCDDKVLRETANQINYSKLRSPYLFPSFFNLLVNTQVISKLNLKFNDASFTSEYLHPSNWIAMKEFESKLLDSVDAPLFKDKLIEKYRIEIDSLYQYLCRRNGLSDDIESPDILQYLSKYGRLTDKYGSSFIDFKSVQEITIQRISQNFQKKFLKSSSDSSARVIVEKELDRKCILAYSIAKMKLKYFDNNLKGISGIDVGDLDSVFNKLISQLKGRIPESRLVTTLIEKKPVLPTKHIGSIDSFKINSRHYSISEGLYEENITCYSKRKQVANVDWIGVLPIHSIGLIRKNPRIFDPINYSFAIQELAVLSGNKDIIRHELDYVRSDPNGSLNYLLYYINETRVDWKDLFEAIAIHSFNDNDAISSKVYPAYALNAPLVATTNYNFGHMPENLTPLSRELLKGGMPGGIFYFNGVRIAASDEEYQSKKSAAFQPFYNLLLYKTYRRINEILLQHNKNLPKDKPCDFVDIFCHLDLIRVTDLQRLQSITANEKNIAACSKIEEYFKAWDLTNFVINDGSKVFLREMILNPALSNFCAIYEVRSGNQIKFINLEGHIPSIPPSLLKAIQNDRNFLFKYNLDLAGATKNAMSKITNAIVKTTSSDYINGAFTQLLRESGYDLIKPSGLGYVPRGPLLCSTDGKIYSAELLYLNNLLTIGLGGNYFDDFSPSAEFIQTANDYWHEAVTVYENNSVRNANGIIAAANGGKDNWEVSVGFVHTVGGQSQLTLDVKINNFAVRLNSNLKFDEIKASLSPRGIPFIGYFNINNLFIKNKLPENYLYVTTNTKENDLAFSSDIPTLAISNSILDVRTSSATDDSRLEFAWMKANPIIGPGPWERYSEDNRFLLDLVRDGISKLTQEEFDQLLHAIEINYFPMPLVEILGKRRDQALEEQNLKGGKWITTDVPESDIIPPGIIRDQEHIDEYIKDFNKTAKESFDKSINEKKHLCETNSIFEDGLPGLKISYSKDFTLMLWSYRWKCVDGSSLENYVIAPVYPGMVNLIKQDPNGHVLEKLSVTVIDDFKKSIGDKSTLRKAEMKRLQGIDKSLSKIQEKASKELKESIKEAYTKYIDLYKKWLKETPNDENGVEHPFEPSPYGSAILSFFPGPYEQSLRKNTVIREQLNKCRNSDFAMKLKDGRILLLPQKL